MANNHNTGEASLTRETDNDLMIEYLRNISSLQRKESITKFIEHALLSSADLERQVRRNTITFEDKNGLEYTDLVRIIEDTWVIDKGNAATTIFRDKKYIYCQLSNEPSKKALIEWIKSEPSNQKLAECLLGPNKYGEHYSRKPVRLEIINVYPRINTDRVRELINKTISNPDHYVQEVRDSKPHYNKSRNILFHVKSETFRHIFGNLNSEIVYIDKNKNKAKLRFVINARPWPCKRCLIFGKHECNAQKCTKCGADSHISKNCDKKKSYCINCRQTGHKTKDLICPIYIREALKEIRHMDIPIEYYEDNQLRSKIINSIIMK